MRLLLDTHILLWALKNDPKLPDKAKELILDERNELYYSTASVWEVAIKHAAHPDKMHTSGKHLSEGCNILIYYWTVAILRRVRLFAVYFGK